MRIFRAVKTNFISQIFGQNFLPLYRELGLLGHDGVDFVCKNGEPLYWDCDIEGKVFRTAYDINGGKGIEVITTEGDKIFKHRFWHLKGNETDFVVKEGQTILTGDLIGYGDTTGMATGSHLHRDMKPMILENNSYKVQFPNNGYFGAIDFGPYYYNIFVLDFLTKEKPVYNFTINLKYGVVNQDVYWLKKCLDYLGLIENISFTKFFGIQTLKAVKDFQVQYRKDISELAGYSINITGYIGTGTRGVLNRLFK